MLWRTKKLADYKSAEELREVYRNFRAKKKPIDLRGSVEIAIIDDEKFDARANLESYGYRFREFQDVRSVRDVQDFDIILCDLMGVGAGFDAAYGGASIIREIKANYPTKIVIAYSAARANTVEAQAAKQYADSFLRKDTDKTDWATELDDAVDSVLDPYTRWITARQELIYHCVRLSHVIELEDAYVSSILREDSHLSEFKRVAEAADVAGHAKGILQGLVASTIYSVLFGA